MLVEVCANSLESALNAEKAGADRIELCSELAVGGITPSYGLLKAVREKISIPVNVLIRPRGGDFTYSDTEFDIMKHNIKFCVELGFNGVVSGVLNKNFTIDVERTQELIKVAEGLHFTFHRAFDWLDDAKTAITQLENLGVDTILTSGQQNTALKGIELLSQLLITTNKITLMPGGGINPENVLRFKEEGFKAVHLSGVKMIQKLENKPKVLMSSTNMLSDTFVPLSSAELIKKLVQAVK